jgi:hypothetical protein
VISEDLWRQLDSQRPEKAGVVRRRVREASGHDLSIAVGYPSHERMLILAVPDSEVLKPALLPATRAIRSAVEPGPAAGRMEIRVILTVAEMSAVFASFVDDVVEAVAQTDSDSGAVIALVSRFQHWQRLLAGESPDGLSRVTAQGLYGELWTLSNVALPALGASAVGGWTGPERENVDFQYEQLAFEVKTTVAHHPPTVRVSSERQLEPRHFKRLFLLALSLDQLSGGSGESLNFVVDKIREQLADSAYGALFADKLLQCGYLTAHRARYDMPRYAIREFAAFRVTGEFPRISEGLLPSGVGHVSYELALTACEPWKIEPEIFVSELQAPRGAV